MELQLNDLGKNGVGLLWEGLGNHTCQFMTSMVKFITGTDLDTIKYLLVTL